MNQSTVNGLDEEFLASTILHLPPNFCEKAYEYLCLLEKILPSVPPQMKYGVEQAIWALNILIAKECTPK